MAYTLGNATFDLASEVAPGIIESEATSDGAAGKTTLVDNSLPITAPEDDHYNKGTIWFLDCSLTSLNGTSKVVTDFATVTGTSTYTFAAANAQTKSGDKYAVANSIYPRYVLRRAINLAVADIGNVDQQSTSLTTVANQSSYTLPTGVYNVVKVEIAQDTSDPYDYMQVYHYQEINGQLQFLPGHQPMLTGYIIRLTYNAPLAELNDDSDTLPNLLNRSWLRWTSKAHALRWRLREVKEDEVNLKQMLNEGIAEAEKRARKYNPMLRNTIPAPEHSLWSVSDGER